MRWGGSRRGRGSRGCLSARIEGVAAREAGYTQTLIGGRPIHYDTQLKYSTLRPVSTTCILSSNPGSNGDRSHSPATFAQVTVVIPAGAELGGEAAELIL